MSIQKILIVRYQTKNNFAEAVKPNIFITILLGLVQMKTCGEILWK